MQGESALPARNFGCCPHLLRAFILFASLLCSCGRQAKAQAGAGYDQPYRPQVHFSPRQHWTNDPNGLIYHNGEYHLFYQYNPLADEWGHMSWGHAVSRDLLHWGELPVAIPEANGVMIFTGSVVLDQHDSSGLCKPKRDCMVAIYTGSSDTPQGPRQNQNLASSLDDGRTWKPYSGNPVLDLHMADFRDPSVSWDDREHQWRMAVSLPKKHKVRFYSSPDLTHWRQLSEFGPAGDVAGDWECPDLLKVQAANGKGNGMWALKVGLNPGAPQGGSGEQYFLGSFDGNSFRTSSVPGAHGWTNYGKDDYCAISFNGLPSAAKPVLIGWMSNWEYAAKLPTFPWRGQMSLPRQLSVSQDGAGIALRQQPVVEPLYATTTDFASVLKGTQEATIGNMRSPLELDLAFQAGTSGSFGVRLYSDDTHWTEIGFDLDRSEFFLDRTKSGLKVVPGFSSRTTAPLAANRTFDVRLIADQSSVEAFAQDGTVVMTDLIFPPPGRGNRIEAFSQGTSSVVLKGKLHELRSIWK